MKNRKPAFTHGVVAALALVLAFAVGTDGATAKKSSGKSTTYYVSAVHPDPNFQSSGQDGRLFWLTDPNSGLPRLSYQGSNNPQYYGYDPVTKRSYLKLKTMKNVLYSYKKGEGLLETGALPKNIIKVKALANNAGIYGDAAAPVAPPSPGDAAEIPPGVLQGSIKNSGSYWSVSFKNEKGVQQSLKMQRPNLIGYTDVMWNALNTTKKGMGMWLAQEPGGKQRIVDVQVNGMGKVSQVVVGPALTKAQLQAYCAQMHIPLETTSKP